MIVVICIGDTLLIAMNKHHPREYAGFCGVSSTFLTRYHLTFQEFGAKQISPAPKMNVLADSRTLLVATGERVHNH